jgi:non-heme chloroperoxidase
MGTATQGGGLLQGLLDNFYNTDVLMPERITEQAWQASFIVAAGASPYATYACVDTWLTDFRADLPKIDRRPDARRARDR